MERLVRQVGHWEPGRWSADGSAGSRADRVYALVQRLADLAAEAEGVPRRTVPRLAESVLPDQIRVMADDLVAAGAAEDVVTRAADDVDAVRRAL